MVGSKSISRASVLVIIMIVLGHVFDSTDAQVTFSKDWNSGKRSVSAPDMSQCRSFKTTLTICQMIIDEVRQIAACELELLLQSRNNKERMMNLQDGA